MLFNSCLVTISTDGRYIINPNECPESWPEIQAISTNVERIESVSIRHYTAAYRVYDETGASWVYLVAE